MKRICKKCGKEIEEDDAKFCPNCGEFFGLSVSIPEKPQKSDGVTGENAVHTTEGEPSSLEAEKEEVAQKEEVTQKEEIAKKEEAARAERAARWEKERREIEEKNQLNAISDSAKRLFILSFVGLLIDFVYGLGALMCIPVAVIASVKAKKAYAIEKRFPTKLIWSMVIGYTGGVFGLIFLILML